MSHPLAIEIGWGTTLALKTIVILMLVPAGALILGYTFLLKMMSHMQSRLGPMDPGGFHGWFQLVGDGIKFIQKEDIIPEQADRRVFAFAPAVVVISTFLTFLVIPAGPDIIVKDLDVGVFYALAVSSLSVIGVLMAGWASANKFSLLGALRAAAQLIAYELPLLLAVVGVVVQAGTMSLQGIVFEQSTGSIFGWDGIGFPFILTQFIGFMLFLIASQAELTQTPFDMPVAESELVAGYMVEYTGLPVPVLLHRRVRHRVRVRGDLGDVVPRRVGAPRVVGHLDRRHALPRTRGALRQDHARRLLDVLGALHLSALAGGPAPGAGVEVPHPDRPRQHPPHRHLQGGLLMSRSWARSLRAGIPGPRALAPRARSTPLRSARSRPSSIGWVER